jgi:hypothetical protein
MATESETGCYQNKETAWWIKIIHLLEPAQKGAETNLLKKGKN